MLQLKYLLKDIYFIDVSLYCLSFTFYVGGQGFYCVLRDWPHSQWNLGDFSPNFEKKNPPKIYIFFFEDWDFYLVNTHRRYIMTFFFSSMATVCD